MAVIKAKLEKEECAHVVVGGILEDAVWLKFPIDRSVVLYRDSSHELNMFAFCLFVYIHLYCGTGVEGPEQNMLCRTWSGFM